MKITFEHGRQILLRQMLLHTCVGHPVAAWLSRLGLRAAAERIHYVTLPRRSRRRRSFQATKFQHEPRLFTMDALWVPLASVPAAFGFYRVASRIWNYGPTDVSRELGACGYSYDCECACGCTGLTSTFGEVCFSCRVDGHHEMTKQQLLKLSEKARRIKAIEDEE